MEKQLSEIVEFAKEATKRVVESGQEQHPIILSLSDDTLSIIGLVGDFRGAFKKEIPDLLRKFKTTAYVFVAEGLGAVLDKDSPRLDELKSGKIRVSDLHPEDRHEAIFINAVEKGKKSISFSAIINYDQEGKRHLGEWETMGEGAEGRLVLENW